MLRLSTRLRLFKLWFGYPVEDIIRRVHDSDPSFLKEITSRKTRLGGAALVQYRAASKRLKRYNHVAANKKVISQKE